MGHVQLVTPPTGPVVPVRPLPGLRHTWTGPDGSTWDLTAGPVRLGAGARGWEAPAPATRWSSRSPRIPGSTHLGSRIEDGQPFWPVSVHAATWEDVDDVVGAFLDSLDPDAPGAWTVTRPGAAAGRTLMCKLLTVEPVHELDPYATGRARFDVYLVADEGLWRGAPVLSPTWRVPDPVMFFPGPPWHLSRDVTTASATLTNPGDLPAWPVWTITGPTTDVVELTLNGHTIAFPIVDAEDVVRIDTDPRRQSAYNAAGDRVTAQLVEHDWSPVPARSTVPVDVVLEGDGAVNATLIPRYRRGV